MWMPFPSIEISIIMRRCRYFMLLWQYHLFLVAYEAHVSTETTKKSPNARIPRASTVGDGTARASAPSPQRTRPSFRVTDMEASHRSSRAVVREVLANGRRVPTALGRFVLGRPGQETGRIFFVVSKSVAKRSTARNRVRRQLREWARRERLGVRLGRNAVAFVESDTASLSRRGLRERVGGGLAKLGIARDAR